MAGPTAGDPHLFSSRGQPLVFVKHEAILQTLDREANGKYLSKESFVDTVDDWNNVPLVFSQDHPEPKDYDKDPEAELKRINGRMVLGTSSGARIDQTGHPTLRITFNLDDPEVEKGIEDGKISISTCFYCPDDGKKLTGVVRPHHILFFREEGKARPGDGGAIILNQDITLTGEQAGGRPPVKTEEEDNMTDSKELEGQLAIARKEAADAKQAFTQLQSEKGELEKALSAKNAENDGLKNEIKAFKQKAADEKFKSFVSKHVPPGMVEGEEKAKAFRKRYDEDPVAIMDEILEFRASESAEDGGAEPKEFTASKRATKEKDVDAELKKFGASAVSVKEA